MAEILATFGTAIEVVTNFNRHVFTPITNQFTRLCFYNGNIQALRDQVEKLNKRRSDLDLEVDEAKRNARVLGSSVEEWIEEVGKISEKKERIIQRTAHVQQGCFYGICPNIKLRYQLSREAEKTAEAAQGLLQEVNKLGNISFPAPLEPIPTASASIQIDSRRSKENEIMEALKDDKVYMIALCGMGGVGKTTMARKVESKVREGKIFGEVVMTVVSRPLDSKNVQQGIAEGLGLKLDEQTTPARAQRLHKRLKETESVLIILDDVWAKFNLQEIGIPSKTTHQRCKIILTSRIQHVCTNIEDSAKIIRLDALPEPEAWNLFKEKAGEIVDEPELHQIAKDVARECRGLPLALVTVAAALRRSSVPSWKDALHQLRASLATDIPEFHEEVYVPLKWSYDQLQNEEARYLFLICCLFPEDYEIRLHVLVEYGFSLDIFSNTVNLEGARNRVGRLIEMLIDRFLLIRVDIIDNDFLTDHYMRYRVKMHDVIRDMAISIASKDKHIFMVMHDIREWPKKDFYENYTCISLSSGTNITLPEKVYCPRLKLLRVESSSRVEMQESSFDGMRGLKVLDTCRIEKFLPSLSWGKNLRSLVLVNFRLKILPNEISELVNLEILRLQRSSIRMLPMELGRLKNLRLLDLTDCMSLKNIPAGVILGLVQLEELYMMPFEYWGGVKDSNASIVELASLTNLTSLQLQADVRDMKLLQDIGNWNTLIRYYVVIGKDDVLYDCRNFDRCIKLNLFELHPLTDIVQVLFDNAQAIKLEGSGSTMTAKKLSRHGYKNVEMLVLSDQELEFIFDSSSWNIPNTCFLPRLTTLVLERNDALKAICHGQPPTGSFSNLTSIKLVRCKGLKKLFSFSVVSMLSKLKFLSIERCETMEAMFFEQNGQYGKNAIITFPKLSKIRLYSLPSLFAFCEATDQVAIQFPQLFEMRINFCSRLKSFHTTKSSSLLERDHNSEQQFFFDQKAMCSGLKELTLTRSCKIGIFDPRIPIDNFIGLESLSFSKCSGCVNLFSNSVSRVMHNLRDLYVDDFEMLQEVITKDEEEQTNSPKVTLFPQLKELQLLSLPKMQQFCHISHGIELPSLEDLRIRSCGLMETFSRNQFNPAFDSNFVVQSFFDQVTCSKLKILELRDVGVIELFNHKISIGDFSGLETVNIVGCERLRSMFSHGMIRDLVNLRLLRVQNCPELQEVMSKDEKEGETNTAKEIIFPLLERLELFNLPKLIRFCHIKNDLAIPSLERIEIRSCHLLETFSLGSVHLPSSVSIGAKDLGSVEGELSKEKFEGQFLNNKQVMNNEGTSTISSATVDGNNEKKDHLQ